MGSLLEGQVDVWQLMFGFVESMTLKCAGELGIADIIKSHGIDSPCPEMTYLARIMRLLVHKNIFTAHLPSTGGETLYGLNHNSGWLLRDSELTLLPMVLMQTNPWQLSAWQCLGQCVKEGGIAFKKAHGCEMWDFASQNPEFNKIFNDGLACTATIVMRAFVSRYGDGLDGIKTLVDVGGGIGGNLAEIVKHYPHVRGINFDLPHVVETAPTYDGISHVGGNMFEAIPNADALFMKWILHDWADEYCLKILQNCRKAISERTGKLILLEIVLQPDGSNDNEFGDMGLVFDLLMFAHTTCGKERTEIEWKKLLEKGGLPRCKITKMPALPSIIEAYPV